MTQEQRGQQVAKSAREIRQEAAKARLEAAKHEDSQTDTVTLSALAKVILLLLSFGNLELFETSTDFSTNLYLHACLISSSNSLKR